MKAHPANHTAIRDEKGGTTWFVTRHPGAREWAKRQGLDFDRLVEHLDPQQVAAGDVVIGSLPVCLAAKVCARGARYLHLCLDLPRVSRGQELSAEELERFHARLEVYHVAKSHVTP